MGRIKNWWENYNTPYSERNIDYLLKRRGKKRQLFFAQFIIYILMLFGMLGLTWTLLDIMGIVISNHIMTAWIIVIPVGFVGMMIFIAVLTISAHINTMFITLDHDICDLFIYLKRMNNECEIIEKEEEVKEDGK